MARTFVPDPGLRTLTHAPLRDGRGSQATFVTLAEIAFADLATFMSVSSGPGASPRRKHGSRRAELLSPLGESGRAVVLIERPDEPAFEAFRADPEVPAPMRSGGLLAPAKFTRLTQVAALPA